MSGKLTHLDADGRARMVDVGEKPETRRLARAEAVVSVGAAIASMISEKGGVAKGDVLGTARLAGIQGAKRVSDLVPLAHPIILDWIDVDARVEAGRVVITTSVACTGRTGVEMEAMTAAAAAALTVYDMVKAASKSVTIDRVRLLEKSGGKSGAWRRGDDP
ncbi:MAG: cyclic pyranopterin monophosphate synthase MoaC [Deltaproteobacteria bacterium]|nr:cyclic pyranopterin monophosphate synthase MoaC [Deltaproteobacteria bacterium]